MKAGIKWAVLGEAIVIIAAAPALFGQTPSYLLQSIGNAPISGVLTDVSGGWDFTAAGTGLQSTGDQLSFAYEMRAGDFDLAVRLGDLGATEAWAQAGLMARDGFTSTALTAATLATPGLAGCQFACRNSGTAFRLLGWFPANYPDTWLRLRRIGSLFSGYASLDGKNWELLGSTNITMPTTIAVGLALSSGQSNVVAQAQFRDLANGSGTITANQVISFEPPGPSSRRTALTFTEIMYNPPDAWATNNLQFVELYNSGTVPEELDGHRLSGDIDYNFPAGIVIAPGEFLVVAKNPAAASAFYGVPALGPFAGNLPNDGGTVRLISDVGGRLLEVQYDTKWPWPVAADGAGHSLVLQRPSYGEGNPLAWAASDELGGSPGRAEHYGFEPARNVVINEFLAHTDLPQLDFVELYNHGNIAVDLSGCYVSDKVETNRFRFPTNTWIAPRGFLLLDENLLGFRLNAAGGKILLRNAARTRVLDALNYDAQENGVAFGRSPDGADRWSRLASPTGGAANAPLRQEGVVLNELMYDPISNDENDQYVELYNYSGASVDMGAWKIRGGVSYTFPTNTTLAANGYLVVAKNSAHLRSLYPQLTSTNTFGDFSGKLSGKGERIALAKPDVIVGTNSLGEVSTNLVSIVVDEVTYATGGRWPRFANKGGSSLELVDPRADRHQPSSWEASDESQKAGWTSVDVTAVLENGQGNPGRLEFFLQGDGEVLIDNLEMLNNGGANLLANPGFESGVTSWVFNGTHRNSFVEDGTGVGGSKALHVIASGRGDAGPNKVYTFLSGLALGNPNTGTIRAQVRWLGGSRQLLLRPSGHWMEAAVTLNVPANPGTPGLPNSRRVTNTGPAIYDVSHTPVLPAVGQPVVVTARAQDPDGLSSFTLSYRLDPATTLVNVAMRDDGTGDDAVAGDGLFSATIPGQASGRLMAFRLAAADGAVPAANSVFPAPAPAQECLVRWGESAVSGTLGTYRIWITDATRNFWTSRERNANDPLDCTFVYGNSRVIYNVGTLYSGSPFHTLYGGYTGPTGRTCDYELNFRPDEKFLGAENFVLTSIDTSQGGTFFPDPSAQVEITGNWIMRKLGQPSNHKRHVHVFVNGLRRGTIYEDSQQPNSEYLDEYYPGDEHGELRKIEDWFEFDNWGDNFGYVTASIEQFNRSVGGIDVKRYRWNWRPRVTDDPNHWDNFTNLVLAMNTPGTGANYVSNVLSRVNVRRWLGPIAVHHLCGDWDSYGYERGKNCYAYLPDDGYWVTFLWDIELCLGDSQSRLPTSSIYSCHDPVLLKMLNGAPAFRREYLGLMLDAVNGPLAPGAADARLDARYAALLRNGLPVSSPSFIKSFLASRRAYLLTQIPNALFAASTPATSSVARVTINGTAPVSVRTILANGIPLAPTWITTTSWFAQFGLDSGSNWVTLTAYDAADNLVGSTSLSVFVVGASPWPPLRINEWMASNTGSALDPADGNADDWFEIYNPALTNVPLAKWSLTDSPANPARYVVPAGYMVPAEGYLLVWADGETEQNTNTWPDLHVDFKLDRSGEAIALFAPDGTLVDQIAFGLQVSDVSEGRWPNGGDAVEALSQPTPGAGNLGVPPTAPFVAVTRDAGQIRLAFNAKAGFAYQVEWTTNLTTANWTSLGSPVVATNSALTVLDAGPGSAQRFYRVVLLP